LPALVEDRRWHSEQKRGQGRGKRRMKEEKEERKRHTT
jgi:hypothetical protein